MSDFQVLFTPQLRDVAGRFAKAEGETLALRRAQLEFLMQRFVNIERAEAPKKTGKFAAGINYRISMQGKQLKGESTSPQPLGTFIRKGTRAHPITARNAKALSFFWANGPLGPGRYFYRSVWHPGTKADDYVRRAHRRWMPLAAGTLRKMALDVSAEMAK